MGGNTGSPKHRFPKMASDSSIVVEGKYKYSHRYVVIYESRHAGWLAYFSTLAEAKRLLKREDEVSYIFKYMQKDTQFQMILRYPFNGYYDCLAINEYKEKVFKEDDDYVIITRDDEDDSLILTHSGET